MCRQTAARSIFPTQVLLPKPENMCKEIILTFGRIVWPNRGITEVGNSFFPGVWERFIPVTTLSKRFRATVGAVTLSCGSTSLCRTAQSSAGKVGALRVFASTTLSRGEVK